MTLAMRALALSMLVLAGALHAQAEQLEVSAPRPALVRLGDLSEVTIDVVGGASRPRRPTLPTVPGLRMTLNGPSRNESFSIIGGRREHRVSYKYTLRIKPERVGRFVIPAFSMFTGSRDQTVGPIQLECEKDVRGAERGFFEVTVLPERVYLNEPFQLVFDYGVDSRLDLSQEVARGGQRYYEVVVELPWLEEPQGVVPVEGADAIRGGDKLFLVRNRSLQEVAYTADHQRNGAGYNRFTFTKTFLPTEVGTLTIGAPAMAYTIIKGRRRPQSPFSFGTRNQTETLRVYSKPIEVEVVPIPTEGRPAGYGNAIGRFDIEATADKARAKVGESVKLTVSIRGLGNTEFLDPPDLPDFDGFHALGKNVNRDRTKVEVAFDLQPLRTDVREIPSVEWSYFDTRPGVEKFVTVATDPIPLTVDPLPDGEGLSALPGEEEAAVVAGVDDIFDMKPVDMSLPIAGVEGPSRAVAFAWVLAPWILCFALSFAWRAHRRRRSDVSGRRAAGAVKRFRSVLREGDATAALAAYLSDRLDVPEAAVIGPDLAERLVARGVEADVAADVQAAIDAGTAARYGGGESLDAARANELVDALECTRWGSGVARAVGGLLLGALFATSGGAQSVDAGEAAYRAGDYATAARAFATAAEDPGVDRRVLYNLGNSLFRENDYAGALVAYERARLVMPRDAELLANIEVVRRKLELGTGEGEPFFAAVAGLRDRFTSDERLWWAVLANLIAAGCLVFGRRAVRWVGGLLLVPALAFAAESAVFGPARLPQAIVLAERLDVVAEPRDGMEAVLKLRQGVSVEFVGGSDGWASVRVDGRQGYVKRDGVGVVR